MNKTTWPFWVLFFTLFILAILGFTIGESEHMYDRIAGGIWYAVFIAWSFWVAWKWTNSEKPPMNATIALLSILTITTILGPILIIALGEFTVFFLIYVAIAIALVPAWIVTLSTYWHAGTKRRHME